MRAEGLRHRGGDPLLLQPLLLLQGPVQCRDKLKTVVVDNPVEECDMEPIRTCKWATSSLPIPRHITKLVPRLVATQECVDVPKEICARSKINPRRIRKPAIQKWCYTIGEEEEEVVAPVPAPVECEREQDCSPGYTCALEEGRCRARPGKVLVRSITVRTATCTGCSTEGVTISLEGERIGDANGGLPAPVPCTTKVLDRETRWPRKLLNFVSPQRLWFWPVEQVGRVEGRPSGRGGGGDDGELLRGAAERDGAGRLDGVERGGRLGARGRVSTEDGQP